MKSWFLAPDFTFTPDGPLQLSAVIPHPSHPTRTLASPCIDAITLPEVQTLVEKNRSHSHDVTGTAGVNVFAKFVELASASMGYEISRRNALGATMTKQKVTGHNTSLSASGPAGLVGVEVGAGISGGKETSKTDSYETPPGIVFAYRLHAIRFRSSGTVSSEMFSNKKLFMTGGAEAEPMEVVNVTADVLKADIEEEEALEYDMEGLGDGD
ncbi:hypothetical protein ACHAPU_001220 [Fusarium lateritium]